MTGQIRIRVDDFPHTKAEPQHTRDAFRAFHGKLVAMTGAQYLLGVIPRRCSVEDVLMLRRETDCMIGMHGIEHDEEKLSLYGNEFAPYLSKQDIRNQLREAKEALEGAVGRRVRVYMPPRNQIDQRTAAVLNGLFDMYTAGPETDPEVMLRFGNYAFSEFPHEYGRSDEMLLRHSHEELIRRCEDGRFPVLTLHWTWETNIGLKHLQAFLERIPRRYFTDFEWLERPDRSAPWG
jgi:hypothetical protein